MYHSKISKDPLADIRLMLRLIAVSARVSRAGPRTCLMDACSEKMMEIHNSADWDVFACSCSSPHRGYGWLPSLLQLLRSSENSGDPQRTPQFPRHQRREVH